MILMFYKIYQNNLLKLINKYQVIVGTKSNIFPTFIFTIKCKKNIITSTINPFYNSKMVPYHIYFLKSLMTRYSSFNEITVGKKATFNSQITIILLRIVFFYQLFKLVCEKRKKKYFNILMLKFYTDIWNDILRIAKTY